MTRLKTASGQFGLIGGICRASSDCILTQEPAPVSTAARWKGHLYIVIEPISEAGRGYQTAKQVLQEISKAYYDCPSPSITTCLARAIQQANRNLFQHNMEVSGHEKVTVGVSCAVVRDDELYLAQVLPGQAYVVHQGRIEAFPLNPSWDPQSTTLPTMARLLALGWTEEVRPEFYHSSLSPGDIFCLCTSNIGRLLGREEAERVLLYQEPGDVVEHLYRLVHQQGFKEGHAVVVEMQPAVQGGAIALFTREGLQERGRWIRDTVGTWAGFLASEVKRLFQRRRKPRPRRVRPRRRERPPEPEPSPEIKTLVRPRPAKPWWVRWRERVLRIFRPEERYPKLQKPRMRTRSRRKRRPRPLLLALVGVTVIVALVLAFIINREIQSRRDAEINQMIDRAEEQIASASQIGDSDLPEANRILDEAAVLLQEIETTDPQRAQPRVRLAQDDLREERDRINSVVRFEERYTQLLVNLNTFSAQIAANSEPGACSDRCFFHDLVVLGNSIYLLEEEQGTVYLYSPSVDTPRAILWAGMTTDGDDVAASIVDIVLLRRPLDCEEDAEETESLLAAIDSDHQLHLLEQGHWESYTLASETDWEIGSVDLEGYMGRAYVLHGAPNQILRYYCGAYELGPDSWLEPGQPFEIGEMVDMAIDGQIYLLQSDGTVLSFLRGEYDQTFSYDVYPSRLVPREVFTTVGSDYLYVVDSYAGRIIQLRKEEQDPFVRQLRGYTDELLAGLTAVFVQEEEGNYYLLAEDGLYRSILALPTTAPPAATPSPTPTP